MLYGVETASLKNPIYTVYAITSEKIYNLTSILEDLTISQAEKEIAQKVSFRVYNLKHGDSWLNAIIRPRDMIYVYANTGDGPQEVFRGYVWEINYKSSDKKELTITAYDQLIYFQESEDSKFFPSGKTTESICSSLCSDWGVTLKYNYTSITHNKLPLRGKLSDIFLTDLLEEVKKSTGKESVMYSKGGTVYIDEIGQNSVIYQMRTKENVIDTSHNTTMSGMVTKVSIMGKKDDDEREPVEAVVEGDIEKYGTIQQLTSKDENTELSEAKKEAQETINEKGKPQETYSLNAIDNPYVRKGDRIKVAAGDLIMDAYVIGITHNIGSNKKTMNIDFKSAPPLESNSGSSNSDESSENTAVEAGKELKLDKCPIYVDSYTSNVANRVTGTYYLYDGKLIRDRYRITSKTEYVGKTPVGSYVTGWIDASNVK